VQYSFLARVFSVLHKVPHTQVVMCILHATSFPCKNGRVKEIELKEMMMCVKTLKPSERLLAGL